MIFLRGHIKWNNLKLKNYNLYWKVLSLLFYAIKTNLIGYVFSSGCKPYQKMFGSCYSKSSHVSLKLLNYAYEPCLSVKLYFVKIWLLQVKQSLLTSLTLKLLSLTKFVLQKFMSNKFPMLYTKCCQTWIID